MVHMVMGNTDMVKINETGESDLHNIPLLILKSMKKVITAILVIFFSLSLHAEPTPRWVKKGVDELNRQRTNASYSFHIFHQEDNNRAFYKFDRLTPLLQYIDTEYNVEASGLTVDSIPANGDLPASYMVTFEKDGQPTTVYARIVDQYQKFEDYADNTSEYDFYQLYAISNPGFTTPDFDNFTLKRKYGIKPVFMSIIPGLGQIYKGEPAKGYTFLGIEAAMVASIVYATTQVNKWNNLAKKNPEFYDNYQSKATTFRQWRTFCLIAGGALYVYNLFDAALAKGARYVDIKKNTSPDMQLTFTPYFIPDPMSSGFDYGLSLQLTF